MTLWAPRANEFEGLAFRRQIVDGEETSPTSSYHDYILSTNTASFEQASMDSYLPQSSADDRWPVTIFGSCGEEW